MSTTATALLPIFLIIALGYAAWRTGAVGESVWSAIEHICFFLLMPFLIVRTLARADLGDLPVGSFITVLVGAVLGMSLLLVAGYALLRRRYPGSGPGFTSLYQGATRFHGFMAIAMIGPLYGDPGLALGALALFVLVPLLNICSVIVLTVYGAGEQAVSARQLLTRIVTNPLLIACFAGIVLNRTGVPDVLFDTIDIIGRGGLGLALLAVGAGLRLDRVAGRRLWVLFAVLTRLIGMPALVILLAWAVGLEGLPRTVAIIAGAVPTAAASYVMARRMGGDAELMSNIVTFQVLAAFVTLPVFVHLAGRL